jgi:hypothetical protein
MRLHFFSIEGRMRQEWLPVMVIGSIFGNGMAWYRMYSDKIIWTVSKATWG